MNETSISLLNQLCQSETGAWEKLHRIYGPLIHKWLLKYDVQSSDVDDLTQEVLLAISKDIGSFEHNGHTGAFRAWLKGVLVNRLRNFWRSRDRRPQAKGGPDIDHRLKDLDDPASQISLIWNKEHDQHVLQSLLTMAEPHFEATSWAAFKKLTLEGAEPKVVAKELGITLNAVFIAKSRILSRLRQEAAGMVESSPNFF